HLTVGARVSASAGGQPAVALRAVGALPQGPRRHPALARPADAAPQRLEAARGLEPAQERAELPAAARADEGRGLEAPLVLEVAAHRQSPVVAGEGGLEAREGREARLDGARAHAQPG